MLDNGPGEDVVQIIGNNEQIKYGEANLSVEYAGIQEQMIAKISLKFFCA